MKKLLQITDDNIRISPSTIMAVQIAQYSFEIDDRFPVVEVYLYKEGSKIYVTTIDEDIPSYVDPKLFKMFCLKWFFNNVELVEEVTNEKETN